MLHLICGDDTYSIARDVSRQREETAARFGTVLRFDAAENAASDILMAAGTASLLADQKLIILEGLGTTQRRRRKKDPTEITLQQLAESATQSTTVLVVAAGVKPDSPLVKDAQQLAKDRSDVKVTAYMAPKGRDLTTWLMRQANTERILLEPKAAALLGARLGDNLAMAGTEMEKLATAAGPGSFITMQLVEELTPDESDQSIFPLIDAIAERRQDQAIQLLDRQIRQSAGGESDVALPLIRLLARQFRQLLLIRVLSDEGVKRPDIVSRLRLQSYYADRYFKQAKSLSRRRIARSMSKLAETEYAIKNGQVQDGYLVLLLTDLSG